MSKQLSEIEREFNQEIEKAQTPDELEGLQRNYLGRKGVFNSLLENIKNLPAEEKQKYGKDVNLLKEKIQNVLLQKKLESEENLLSENLKKEKLDWSLPPYPVASGHAHPVHQVLDEISEIFLGMGFAIAEGPEVESEEYNFDKLNIPEDHPAKDMHDTFYVNSGADSQRLLNFDPKAKKGSRYLLRTHTSPVQIREFLKHKQAGDFPIRIIAPGKVYRHEAIDATHSSVFHQVEGLVVGKTISFADLKGTLEVFVKRFFGPDIKTKFLPSFFPFVEPGAEMHISCTICGAKNPSCPVCKGTGWLEMLGAGMVHPNVFKAVGYDPEEYSGFAFGMGVERIAMIRYGISDMRLFFENHVDFLSQF